MKNIKFYKSIKMKILTMFFATTLCIATILIFMSQSSSLDILLQLINKNEAKNVELYSEIVGDWFYERMSEIEIYANTPLIKEMNWEKTKPYLKREIENKLDIYDNLFIADRQGNCIDTTGYEVDIQERKFFKSVMAGKTIVSNPIISKSTHNQVIMVVAPIKNQKGKIIGLIGADLNLGKLNHFIKKFKVVHKNSYSYLLTKNGIIVTHPDRKKIMREIITTKDAYTKTDLSQILKDSEGRIITDYNNTKSISYFHEIPNTDRWKIVTKIPIEYMKQPIRKMSIKLLWIGIVGIVLTNILGLLMARKISKPIIQLNEVFLKGAEGDLTVKAEIYSQDEIGRAAKSFNEMMEKIRYMTYYDPLTDLPNRGLFAKQLKHALVHAKRKKEKLAVMVLGVDRFKNINDILGHDIGDKLLKSVGAKLKNCVSEEDAVSRIGGSEFTLLFPEIGKDKNPAKIAQNILDIMDKQWIIEENEFYNTASIGIAFFPDDGKDTLTLLKNADTALHRAKEKGGNNYQLYTSSMNEKMIEQLALDKDLHYALENKELMVYYQPKVAMDTQSIMGMEALVRWSHPQRGMISPAMFIPLAEENGCILEIGEWVLYTACKQNKLWQDAGYEPVSVAVNISARQFGQQNFVDMVIEVLEETKLDPKYLELEITESIAVEDIDYTVEVLRKLKDMDIKIAMDDFGTGYSSLSYLKKFSIDNLKIDQSFVRDIVSNKNDAAIASTIIAMGNSLNIKVTAEGVEYQEQLDFLKKQHCDYIQGYLFSKPVPSIEFEKMLKKSK